MLKQRFKSCCDSCKRTENLALDTKAKRKLTKNCIGKRYRENNTSDRISISFMYFYLS